MSNPCVRFAGRAVSVASRAGTGRHVGFESRLKRDRLMPMDFDPSVVGIGSQPFWLHWHDGERERRHAPDYFVRRAEGGRSDRAEGRRGVRGDASALRPGWVEVRAAGDTGRGAARECPVAVALPAPAVSAPSGGCPAPGGLRRPGTSHGGADATGDRLSTLPELFHLLWIQDLTSEPRIPLRGPRDVPGGGPPPAGTG